jgi:hypothetical protein
MFILGPLLVLCGSCVMSMPLIFSAMPQDKLQPMLDQIQSVYNYPAAIVLRVLGGVILLPGIVMLTLAFFVRRGGRVSAILASVLTALILLKSVVEIALSFVHGLDSNAAGAVCVDVLSLALFGLLLFWLIQAIRGSSSVNQAQQQYLAQYWQYQQTMQAHGGYGYAAPPQEGQAYPTPPPLPGYQLQPPPPPPANLPPASNDSTAPPPSSPQDTGA